MTETESFLDQLRRDGHVRHPQARLTPLTGGVSSDIYLVEAGAVRFVVKRALARLRVADEWLADVRRNATERQFLEYVSGFRPEAVPRVLFANPEAGYFGMEHLGDGFANWKQLLLDGVFDTRHARCAGSVLGEIHRRTAGDRGLCRRFDTTESFHQLRTAPYLLHTAERHPTLRGWFAAAAERVEATRECLVHGDFSPKNILVSGGRLVVLDGEVAWYGDPAFDVAFLLNHLFLKRLRHAPAGGELAGLITAFWRTYWETRADAGGDFEERVADLLPLLLLARVDGKSPVEYLDPQRKALTREFVERQATERSRRLATLATDWFNETARTRWASPTA